MVDFKKLLENQPPTPPEVLYRCERCGEAEWYWGPMPAGILHEVTRFGQRCRGLLVEVGRRPRHDPGMSEQIRRKKLVANPPGSEQMHRQVAADETRVSSHITTSNSDSFGSDERNPLDWEGPNKVRAATFDPELDKIIETVVRVRDPEAIWRRLEEGLRVGEGRYERAHLVSALDDAETNARLAHRLWMTAKLAQAKWEMDNAVVFGAMRIRATKVLQDERDQKIRSKTITNEDVDSMIAAMHPDEWRDQETRRERVKALVQSMEHLTKMWGERVGSLQAMLGKHR